MTPAINRVLETCLYVEDVNRSRDFYERVLGLTSFIANDRMCGLAAGNSVLLLFLRGGTTEWVEIDGGRLPPHDGSGTNHFAFAIDASMLEAWKQRLASHNVPITSEVHWALGGTSIYFSDPDGHVVEMATPGVWPIY